MKKILIIVFVSLLSLIEVFSQNTQFSYVYNIINGNEYGTRLLSVEEGYFLLSIGICDPNTTSDKKCCTTISINHQGEIEKTKTFVDRYKFAPSRSLHKVKDTVFIFGTNFWKTPYEWKVYETNFEGDSLGGFMFSDFTEDHVRGSVMDIKDNFIYLVGETFYHKKPQEADLVVLKLDKLGNKIKEERFLNITPRDHPNFVWDFVKTEDGNFILAFDYLDHDKVANIIKFDENLETIWTKRFNPFDWAYNLPDLCATKDSGFVFTWGIYTVDIRKKMGLDSKFGEGKGTRPTTVFKIDKDGNIEWSDTLWTDRIYHTAPRMDILEIIEAKNGDIIAVGDYHDYEQKTEDGWICRYNSQGELLWQKVYRDKLFTTKQTAFLDVQEQDNGDITVVGRFYNKDGEFNDEVYTWLLRLDNLGCYEPGCGTLDTIQIVYTSTDYITSTNEVISDYSLNEGILLYPNPVKNKLNVILTEFNEYQEWRILDSNGNIIMIGREINLNSIDVSKLDSGLYLLQIKDDKGKLRTGKFVVI